MSKPEQILRRTLCAVLKRPADQAPVLDMGEDLTYGYGLTSLDLIMLMTAVCNEAGVPLTEFTEEDIAALRTPSDIVRLLNAKVPA